MTRRLDFNIFSLGGIALGLTILISLFAGISAKNSSPSSDIPYSHNLEKSSSGSYLNLLVAESEENTSLEIHTNKYPTSSALPLIEPPQSESITPETPSVTVQPAQPEPVKTENSHLAENTTSTPTESAESTEPTSKPTDDHALDSLISDFNARDEKISALLDQLNDALDRLYPEKIIYQPELDALYPVLSELDQLITLESDFVSAHSDELPDFYHKRHESNLSAFSALRNRLDYLLAHLKPLSEDINTYSYASLCKPLPQSSLNPEETSSDDSELADNSDNPESTPESAASSIANIDNNPDDSPTADSTDNSSTTPTDESINDSDSSDPALDSFGFPICSDASYVAEKAFDFYSLSLSNWGDSSSWRESALSLGLTVDNSPSAHSIGIDLSNELSPHVIWVESLSSSTESTPAPASSPSPVPTSTSEPTISPISTPNPTTTPSSILINLSEYDSILTPKNFSYRTNISSSPYIFIHLDSIPRESKSSEDSLDTFPLPEAN